VPVSRPRRISALAPFAGRAHLSDQAGLHNLYWAGSGSKYQILNQHLG
jgi:hypothetical protein